MADADVSARRHWRWSRSAATGGPSWRPASDLDVVLLYQGRQAPALVSERLWYPVWDAKLKLGHAVRTVKEALRLAADDLETATSLLTVRHLAGDPELTVALADGARAQWRRKAGLAGPARRERSRSATREHGEVAFLLEPNLKEGRGGLRDVHALAWAARPRTTCWPAATTQALREAYEVLLAARVELHRVDRPARRRPRPAGPGRGGRPAAARRRRRAHGRRQRRGPHDLVDQRRGVAPGARRRRATFGSWDGRERAVAPGISERQGEVHLDDDADPTP